MTVTPDDDRAVAVAIPAAMPAAVMFVELGARTAKLVTVAIVVAIAADAETKTLGARYCRRCNRKGRQRAETASHLPHLVLLSVLHGEKTILTLRRPRNSRGTFLNGCSDGFAFETWGRVSERASEGAGRRGI